MIQLISKNLKLSDKIVNRLTFCLFTLSTVQLPRIPTLQIIILYSTNHFNFIIEVKLGLPLKRAGKSKSKTVHLGSIFLEAFMRFHKVKTIIFNSQKYKIVA